MFKATLFTKTKTWKQPKHPLTHEQVRKTWCKHTVKYYSALTKEGNPAIYGNMDEPGIQHAK